MSEMHHPEKVRVQRRREAMLTGGLGAVMLLVLYVAAFELDSWADWAFLGALVLTAIGGIIAIQTRMN